MSTTLHETPTRPSSPRPPRRRPVALVVAGAVLVAAIGSGAALALGGRSADRSDQPAAAAAQPAVAQPAAAQATKAAAPTPASRGGRGQRQQDSAPARSSRPPRPAAQARGRDHPDRRPLRRLCPQGRPDRDLIVVDLVQVFTGDAAVQAALEDGMDRSAAEVRDTYVRNQNDRLRTLEMAGGVRLNLIGSCESTGQDALFTKLIKDATSGQGQLFYYTLHVQGAMVRRSMSTRPSPPADPTPAKALPDPIGQRLPCQPPADDRQGLSARFRSPRTDPSRRPWWQRDAVSF